MQESSTTIIKHLDIDQIISFKKEIDTLDSELWSRHVPENFYTALVDGKSIYLSWIKTHRIPVNIPTYADRCPNIYKFITECVYPLSLGKAFIHRLHPGHTISRHRDLKIVTQSNLKKRFHVYLQIPAGLQMELDEKIVIEPENYSNTLVDFSLTRFHSYANYSSKDFVFIVFDQCEIKG